jgi:integrase
MSSTQTVNRYRLFRRHNTGIFFVEDNKTARQESLRTRDREEAERIAFHRNESERLASGHRQIAVAYLQAADPRIKTRTWAEVMDFFCAQPGGKAATLKRKVSAMKDKALAPLRALTLIETTPEHFLSALAKGTVATNCYLRKVHNLARRMKWLPDDVLCRGAWPVVRYGVKRAITREEHQRILAVTPTEERRLYYQVLWETGAAQSDIAKMTADCIDWDQGTIRFKRQKLERRAMGDVLITMGPSLEDAVSLLPKTGSLFPTLAAVGENDRATAFGKHCAKAGIEGVTLHSYRYASIQRAKACGYNKRHAMAMSGQRSERVHDEYAEGGTVTIPSLEEVELAFQAAQAQRAEARRERRNKIIDIRRGLSETSDQAEVG